MSRPGPVGATTASSARGGGRGWMVVAAGAVGLAFLAMGAGALLLAPDRREQGREADAASAGAVGTGSLGSPPETGAVSASSSSRPAGGAPWLRHACSRPPASGPSRCGPGAVAWCDADEAPIACCGQDLVPVGREGACGCPPGGVAEGSAAPPQCLRDTRTPSARSDALGAPFRALTPALRRCLSATLGATTTAKGPVTFTVELTPDGRVFSARVREASGPDRGGQLCALALLRAAEFPPPTGGMATLTLPLAIEP